MINYPDDFTPSEAVVTEDERVQTMVRTFEPNVSLRATGNVLIRNAGIRLEVYRLESTIDMPEDFANEQADWTTKNEIGADHVEALIAALKFLSEEERNA